MEAQSPILDALYRGEPVEAADDDLDVLEAAALGRVERLRALLDEDPQRVHERSRDDFTPLHYAAFFGGADAARVLLERGAEVDAYARNDQLHVTPLHSAAAARNTDVARLLLEHGADANAEQQGGFTAMDAARENGDEELADLLRAHGARG